MNFEQFDPTIQYRCDFIRGKSLSNMEDYLSVYTSILNEICPISIKDFNDAFDFRFAELFHIDTNDISAMKFVKNHRTENVTKILGLVYRENDVVCLSRRTIKYIEDNDQPALFKSVCFQFQQPNAAQTKGAFSEKIKNNINFRPFHFIVKLLKIAHDHNCILKKDDIYYYVLNCLQTLQGLVSPEIVFERIIADREQKIVRKVSVERNPAWTFQHMREQLDYLVFANIIRVSGKDVVLNTRESKAIELFIRELDLPLRFDCQAFIIDKQHPYKVVEDSWLYYMGTSPDIDLTLFNTSVDSMDVSSIGEQEQIGEGTTSNEIGDRGEVFVIRYEKNIVRQFNERLVNRVIHLGRTKGLGYDIQSIEANRALDPNDREMARFIEVKTSFRTTPPDPNFQTSVSLTNNEWQAARQQREHYYIYRLFFTNSGTFLYILNNPIKKYEDNLILASPVIYRVEYRLNVADEQEVFIEHESQ